MTQPSLNQEKEAKLKEILKMAQKTEEKFLKLDEMSATIAKKWRQRREERRSVN